jgi:hypothetical protein
MRVLMMKTIKLLVKLVKILTCSVIMLSLIPYFAIASDKPRLVVLTDIGGDPDDQMSMVRLMTYSNQIDIEGLIATASGKGVNSDYIKQIVSAYGKVRNNLELHEPGFPKESYLQGCISEGVKVKGMQGVGEGKDTPGSDLLISVVDRSDSRPVWVAIWGGPNVLAQSLWKVRSTRSPEGLSKFIAKIRVYAISDQDNSGPWIREQFPELFYIVTPGGLAGDGFHHSTWIAIGGDKFHGRFGGADYSLVTNEWLDKNIRSKGSLGAIYPLWKYMMEGDTPSYLNLVNNGLSDPEHPEWGGWGGRYELYKPHTEKWFLQPETRPIWTNVQDEVMGMDGEWHTTNHATVWRWRSAYQNDFAARMDWTIKPYNEANHPPVVKLDHPAYIKAKAGERVDLSAKSSTDPDGNELSFQWFCYEEAGTRSMGNYLSGVKQEINDSNQPKAWLIVNNNMGYVKSPGTGTMHIILAVTDHGTPHLTRYQRIIIDVIP